MIGKNEELQAMLERIERFQRQSARLREVETNPTNYRLSVDGYLKARLLLEQLRAKYGNVRSVVGWLLAVGSSLPGTRTYLSVFLVAVNNPSGCRTLEVSCD